MVKRLTTDIDELHEHIRTLENDKETVIMDKNKLNDQLRKLEEKMHGVQDLNQIVEDQNSNLQRKHSTKHLVMLIISHIKSKMCSQARRPTPLIYDTHKRIH